MPTPLYSTSNLSRDKYTHTKMQLLDMDIGNGLDDLNSTADPMFCFNCTSTTPGGFKVDSYKKNQTVMNSSIMFGSGLIGNFLALLVLARSPASQRRTIFYRLVAGLVVTDLTGTTATSPVVISVYVNNFKWIGGDAMCQYFSFMMEFAGTATVFIICAMSLERYACIRHPYFYHTRLTPGHALKLLAIIWIASLVVALFPILGFGRNVLQYPNTWCFFDSYSTRVQDKIYCYLFGIIGVLSIIATFVCNGIVMYTLTRVGCKHKVLNNRTTAVRTTSRRSRYAEIEMLVLLTVFTLTFGICWGPLVVRVIINQTGLVPRNNSIDLLMIRMASINQILDPWVYILLKRELVWRIISIMKTLFCRRQIEKSHNGTVSVIAPKRERDYYLPGEEPSCLTTCRGCLCDPPDVPYTNRNVSPAQTRREETYQCNGSLYVELTVARKMRTGASNNSLDGGNEYAQPV